MQPIILHHYPVSHYAEKARRILAYKQLPWYSVEQPLMMPKPELLPLTGGYRRIPVMQIGADVYCDSACICRRIEQRHPGSPVIPAGVKGMIDLIEDWADRRFMWQALLPGFVDLSPQLPADVMEDRAKMSPELTKENFFKGAPHALSQALLSMKKLEALLGDKNYLLGDSFTLADAACFFVLFFMSHSPRVFDPAIATVPKLGTWFQRVQALGATNSTEMNHDEAMTIAKQAEPEDLHGGTDTIPALAMAEGFALGQPISVTADDYGREAVTGTLGNITEERITVLREDRELGNIAVHFPRTGYRLTAI